MKLVTAIVQRHRVEEVKDALLDLGVEGLTLTDVHGFGRQGGQTESYRGAEYRVEFLPKARLDVFVTDAQVGLVVDAITRAARTGEVGDGKVIVCPLESVVRIRTGEEDEAAL